MAKWKDIPWKSDNPYEGYQTEVNCTSGGNFNNNIFIGIQYDSESASPASINIRLKAYTNANIDDSDDLANYKNVSLYVLWDIGNKDGPQLLPLKPNTVFGPYDWPYFSETLTLTKEGTAANFIIPTYIICLCPKLVMANTVADYTAKEAYEAFTSGDYSSYGTKYYRTELAIYSEKTVAEVGDYGSLTVTDNGNNTITLSGNIATAESSDLNPVKSARLKYNWTEYFADDADIIEFKNFIPGESFSKTIENPPDKLSEVNKTQATRKIYAWLETTKEYSNNKTRPNTVGIDIAQYVNPNNPTNITLIKDPDGVGNAINEIFCYRWNPVTGYNDNSTVKGYRVYVYKNPTSNDIGQLMVTSGDSSEVVLDTKSNNTYIDMLINPDTPESTQEYGKLTGTINPSFIQVKFTPADLGFSIGDTVSIGVLAFTTDGKGNQLLGNFGTPTFSESTTLNNIRLEAIIRDLHHNNYFFKISKLTDSDDTVFYEHTVYAAEKVKQLDGSTAIERVKDKTGADIVIKSSSASFNTQSIKATVIDLTATKYDWYLVRVRAFIEIEDENGNVIDKDILDKSVPVKNYVAPIKAYSPYEESGRLESHSSNSSYDSKWVFKWQQAEPGNASSDITGYRVRLYCNGTKTAFISADMGVNNDTGIYNRKCTTICDNNGNPTDVFYDFYLNAYSYDKDSKVLLKILFNLGASSGEFSPPTGGKIKLAIIPFVSMPALTSEEKALLEEEGITLSDEYKDEELLFLQKNELAYSSPTYTVSNADHLQVKTNNGWKPGRVFVYFEHKDETTNRAEDLDSNGEWIQASTLYVKTNSGWSESQ